MLRKILRYIFFVIITLLLIMGVKTFLNGSKQIKTNWNGELKHDSAAVFHLCTAIKFKTISSDLSGYDFSPDEHIKLVEWMRKTYPACFKMASVYQWEGGLLLEFPGSKTNLKPAVFLAHLDVVPVDTSDLKFWKFPPFEGVKNKDTVYGRGTLDDKVIAISMLESMEKKLSSGFKNLRPIYFAFGFDEEIGGNSGARVIAGFLEKAGVKAEFIMDEGLGVTEGIVPGISRPAALIGISEKGFLTLKLSVKMDGGHSGMPKKENAASVLNAALTRLDKSRIDEKFSVPMQKFLEYGAPEMSFGYRFLFSNLWITNPLVKMVMRGNEKTAASIQTTHVTTRLQAGVKDNVVPNIAAAWVNFRILPGSTMETTLNQAGEIVNDPRVNMEITGDRNNPGPVSPTEGDAWNLIATCIGETFNQSVTIPAQVISGTDCKHYTRISDRIYRFVPLRLNNGNTSGIHGINERIAVKNYMECIAFYSNLFGKL